MSCEHTFLAQFPCVAILAFTLDPSVCICACSAVHTTVRRTSIQLWKEEEITKNEIS